jgi:hypothetical protein
LRLIAYLDANSGSLIASAIAAGFAGVAVVFRVGWRRTLTFFSPKRRAAARAEAHRVPEPSGDDAS